MFEDDLLDQSCDRHGIDRHMLVHEAGHAVSALDNGILFRAVIVCADGDGPKLSGDLREAGAAVDTQVPIRRCGLSHTGLGHSASHAPVLLPKPRYWATRLAARGRKTSRLGAAALRPLTQ